MTDLPNEWTYLVLVPGEGWSGVLGEAKKAKAGSARAGRITGGVVNAETEQVARLLIKDLHGEGCEVTSIESRTWRKG
jgi:hypothetical protein